MTSFKRHLPSDTSLTSLHLAIGRLWDALEAQGGVTANAPVSTQRISPSVTVTSSGGSSSGGSHNALSGLQGGDVGNYYHMTSAEYAGSGTGVFVRVTSPSLLGSPVAPTPAVDDSSTLISTTAFYHGQVGTSDPVMNGVAAPGTSTRWSPADHVHPSDTSRLSSVSVTSPITGDGTTGSPITIPVFTNTATGTVPVPSPAAGSTKYLREDATWAVPAGGGGGGATLRVLTADLTVSDGYSYVVAGSLDTNGFVLTLDGGILGVI